MPKLHKDEKIEKRKNYRLIPLMNIDKRIFTKIHVTYIIFLSLN